MFLLKTNSYRKKECIWILENIKRKFHAWCNKWISRVGRLVLVKEVLEVISVYWSSLDWIPKGILTKIRQLSFHFMWDGSEDKKPMVLASCQKLANPKVLGGWGLKNIFFFSKALAAKIVWWLIQGVGLWAQITKEKYFPHEYIIVWIQNPSKQV
jgi:hypothetical protein